MAAPVLSARSLYRFFRAGEEETFALQGVGLEVGRGETVAVTGPSGSGMIRENGPGILLNPWAVVAPGLAIGLLAISVNLAANALAPATARRAALR